MCLAIPGQIVTLLDGEDLAVVDVGGVRRNVNVGLLHEEPAQAGDWVLIHVGFALSKISAEDAEDQMRVIAMLGESDAARQEIEGYGSNGQERDPTGGSG
jgi:hydrogenase expression/formation protein HypC